MNKKYFYKWTADEDCSTPGNNYSDETYYIITDGDYDFEDWLTDNSAGYMIEREGNTYYLVDAIGRTGEAYWLIGEEDTNEEMI